jgi:iron complex transport system ATP-binding protein
MWHFTDFTVRLSGRRLFVPFSQTLPEKGLVFLCGANGSGKSSLLNAMCGELEFEGEVLFQGQPPDHSIFKQVSYLEQHPHVAFPLTARDLIQLGAGIDNPREPYNSLIETSTYPWARWLDRQVNTLSGGERQLVWLAHSLMRNPLAWLIDEPGQYLDLRYKKFVYDWLQAESAHRLIICISHDLDMLPKENVWLWSIQNEAQKLEPASSENLNRLKIQLSNEALT